MVGLTPCNVVALAVNECTCSTWPVPTGCAQVGDSGEGDASARSLCTWSVFAEDDDNGEYAKGGGDSDCIRDAWMGVWQCTQALDISVAAGKRLGLLSNRDTVARAGPGEAAVQAHAGPPCCTSTKRLCCCKQVVCGEQIWCGEEAGPDHLTGEQFAVRDAKANCGELARRDLVGVIPATTLALVDGGEEGVGLVACVERAASGVPRTVGSHDDAGASGTVIDDGLRGDTTLTDAAGILALIAAWTERREHLPFEGFKWSCNTRSCNM